MGRSYGTAPGLQAIRIDEAGQPSGGAPAQALIWSSSLVHVSLSWMNQFSDGGQTLGSSKDPAVIQTVPGSESNVKVNGLPQVPQCVRIACSDDRYRTKFPVSI